MILTILLIIFIAVFVVSTFLYFWPKIKAFIVNRKGKKKVDKEKHFELDKREVPDTPAEPMTHDEPPHIEPSEQEKIEELSSIKEFLKMPPKKEASMVEDMPLPSRRVPGSIARRSDIERQRQELERQRQEIGDYKLPSINDLDDNDLWDDDLAKRLYIDDRRGDEIQKNPFDITLRGPKEATLRQELSNLSPEMKKILISDLLKKKH